MAIQQDPAAPPVVSHAIQSVRYLPSLISDLLGLQREFIGLYLLSR